MEAKPLTHKNEKEDLNGGGLLSAAVKRGRLALVQSLINNKANINAKGSGGRTPLHLAAYNHFVSIVEYLLKKKANVHTINVNGDQPLHVATAKNFLDVNGDQPSRVATAKSCPVIVRLLVDAKANINTKGLGGRTPLHWSMLKKDEATAKCLLDLKANVGIKDFCGQTPLDYATTILDSGRTTLNHGDVKKAEKTISYTNKQANTEESDATKPCGSCCFM